MASVKACGKKPNHYLIRWYEDGRGRKETFIGTRAQAKKRANHLEREKWLPPQERDTAAGSKGATVTVTEWSEAFLDALPGGPGTRTSRRNSLKPFIQRFGTAQFAAITPSDVRLYMAYERDHGNRKTGKPLADPTLRSRLAELRRLLWRARAEGLLSFDPSEIVDVPPRRKSDIEVLTEEEVRLWMELSHDSPEEVVFGLGFFAGLRRGEMAGLRRSDVHLEEGDLLVRKARKAHGRDTNPKTDRSTRTVPIPPSLVELLVRHFARQDRLSSPPANQRDDRMVCTGWDGRPLSLDWMTKMPARFAAAHGLRRIRLHDSRHTYATLLLEAGVALPAVKTYLGHAAESITAELYGHVTPRSDRDARRVLQAIAAPEPE